MLHSAGKTTVSMMKRDLAVGELAEKVVPGGDKPSNPPGHDKPGSETETPDTTPPTTGSSTTRRLLATSAKVASEVEIVPGRSIKREYGYILSHIPFGPSISKTLASI